MTATVHWTDNHQDSLTYTFWGDCFVQDYRAVMYDSNMMICESVHPVHHIINLRLSTKLPVGMLSSLIYHHAKSGTAGLLILVGANRYLREITDIVDAVTPDTERNVYYAKTLDEAYGLIEQTKVTLLAS
ncbi:MAG: hypothetical protein RLP44_31895 [Aggregatilineales bacterium]